MRFGVVIATYAMLFAVVLFDVGPEVVLESRRPLPDGAPIPATLASGTHCYRVAYVPRSYGLPWYGPAPAFFCLSTNGSGAHWRMAGQDSLEVVLPADFFIGYCLRLSARTDTLAGHAWVYADMDGYSDGASVRATPVP